MRLTSFKYPRKSIKRILIKLDTKVCILKAESRTRLRSVRHNTNS